jgi:tetratricopeptide (TPR) repeat protein
MFNLSAEIFLNKGVRPQAGQLAEEALKLSRKSGDRREEANALRLLGGIELIEKRAGAAIVHFKEALAIDKELALSRKISADLRALSQSYESMGVMSDAAAYLQRAFDAALADGELKQSALDLEKLALLYERSGQKEAVAKTEELRRKLLQENK